MWCSNDALLAKTSSEQAAGVHNLTQLCDSIKANLEGVDNIGHFLHLFGGLDISRKNTLSDKCIS